MRSITIPGEWRIWRARAVHIYTSLGLPCAFLALLSAQAGQPRIAFIVLLVAILIDGTDGPLARRWDVKRWTPNFDGRKLDDIIDYLTYVFVPAFILYQSQLVAGWGVVALLVGVVVTALAIGVFLARGLPARARGLLAFALLCAAFFGAYELLSLALIEGLGSTVLVASAAVTGGLLGWSIVGLRPRPGARPDRAVVGPLLVTIAFAALIGGLWAGGTPGVLTVIAGAALSGVGMGAAYPLLSSEPFESDAAASTVGTLIAFAETAATAWAALLAGGAYSVLHTQGWTPTQALIVVFAGLAAIGVAAVACAATRRGRSTAAG